MAIALKCNPCDSMIVTSVFGWDILLGKKRWHNGEDYKGIIGNPTYCVNDGIVRVAKNDANGYGNYIVVEHDGFCTLYAHLSKFNVAIGQKLTTAQIIGLIGNTGQSTGPHLHFEIRDCKYGDFWLKDNEKARYAVDPNLHTIKDVLPLSESIKILQSKCKYDDKTIAWYLTHPWPQHNLSKLVKNLK